MHREQMQHAAPVASQHTRAKRSTLWDSQPAATVPAQARALTTSVQELASRLTQSRAATQRAAQHSRTTRKQQRRVQHGRLFPSSPTSGQALVGSATLRHHATDAHWAARCVTQQQQQQQQQLKGSNPLQACFACSTAMTVIQQAAHVGGPQPYARHEHTAP
jgi:hypothetical protein